ncbi:MAG: FAD binding domain-containing protein, partial [Elusimicrobiota bacterium]
MRGSAPSMKVIRPQSAAEAVSLYAQHPKAAPLAGGTDFMVLWNLGERNGRQILDLSAIPEWRGIHKTATGLRIGALATHAEIRDHAQVKKHLPLLAQACAVVGAAQIQNRGTLGGNIANASPAGDTFPAL